MPRGDESTDSDSDRDSYSSDSAETEEDYEKKDEDVDSELSFTLNQFGPLESVRTSKGSTTPEVASEASFRVKLLGKWESNSCNSTLHQPCS